MGQRIQSAVFGATGYSGFELVRLLARHDGVKKPLLFQRNGDSAYRDLSEAYPQLAGDGGEFLETNLELGLLRRFLDRGLGG